MSWPLVSWILSSSSSSSSYDDEDDEETDYEDTSNDTNEQDIEDYNDRNIDVLSKGRDLESENDDGYNVVPENSDLVNPIPTAIAVTGNPSSFVTVAIPGPSNENEPLVSMVRGRRPGRRNAATTAYDEKKNLDKESRKLSQRFWTTDEEIQILNGFLEYITEGKIDSNHLHQRDAALFYDKIKSKINLGCNKNQLIEKLRRLKRKHQILTNKINTSGEQKDKFSFKTPHEHASFEISKKIWGSCSSGFERLNRDDNALSLLDIDNDNKFVDIQVKTEKNDDQGIMDNSVRGKRKSSRQIFRKKKWPRFELESEGTSALNEGLDSNDDDFGKIMGLVEEILRGCLSPLYKELLSNVLPPLSFGKTTTMNGSGSDEEIVNERWRKQQVVEMEVYLKRLELVLEKLKISLQELRSRGK